MQESKDFPLPLNEFVEEEIPVRKNRFDEKTGKIFSVTEIEKVKTKYIDAPKEKMRCKDSEHIFSVIDGSRGLFSCTKCPFFRKVYPSSYKFVDGKLINKRTGLSV